MGVSKTAVPPEGAPAATDSQEEPVWTDHEVGAFGKEIDQGNILPDICYHVERSFAN